MTNEAYKARETAYNPITQTYRDNQLENVSRAAEQQSFIHKLAANKDRALRYEQTYNVINFENKLAGLEDRADYPKEKPWYFRPDRDSLVDYNIVTNYSLQDHYFDAPDKRPECKPFVVKTKPNYRKDMKDYDIVSNKYKEHHDAKIIADEQIGRGDAAKKYWKTHEFDIVNCKYYEDDKE